MAIVFNKQLQANRLNLTFNNNVVEFYSDSGHSDHQRALDKYNHIVNKGELKKIAVLETIEKEENE